VAEFDAARRLVRFGVFELDVRSGELRKAGSRLTVSEQPLNLLIALLDRPGEVVTRDELRERLWPADTFVDFEHGLNAAVKRLRDALGDSADTPRFIETVPRRGYRFIAPVDEVGVPAASGFGKRSAPQPRPRQVPVVRIVVAAAVVLGAGVFGSAVSWWTSRHGHVETARSTVPQTLRRVTFGSGFDTDATWSPDGRFIAYSSNRSGNLDIWVQAVSGGEPEQIMHSPSADTQPTWSPDGNDTIVFRSERNGGGLFAVPAHGGPERQLTTFGLDRGGRPTRREYSSSRVISRRLSRDSSSCGWTGRCRGKC
jgi:DNA-binding winged helix-turn-helix (wHTH) protein